MQERRKFVRLNANVDVKWAKITDKKESLLGDLSVGKNISGGGICLTAYGGNIGEGDMLYLEIELPTKKIVKTKCKVAWVGEFEIIGGRYEKRYDVGVEFLEIKDEDREEINKFIFSITSKER